MKTNLEIAQEATLKPIIEIAESIGIASEDLDLFGKHIAKINLSKERKKEIFNQPKGKYSLVTATSPTPAGDG